MAVRASAAAGVPTGTPRRTAPAWAAPASLLLCIAGLGISVYLTIDHYSTATVLSCPSTGVINCVRVTNSPQSVLFGIVPVALLGLLYFVAMTLLCSPLAWRDMATLRWARLTGVVCGVLMVCYLVYAEFYLIGAVCLWCSAVHVITFVLFVVVLTADALSVTPAPTRKEDI